MKLIHKILILLGIVVAAFLLAGCDVLETTQQAVTFPEPTNYVVDVSDVLSASAEAKLNQTLKDFDKTAQIAVVTVKTTQPLEYTDYALQLARKWGIGSKEKNNGVLFLIVTGDRKVRIETGRGAEGNITDSEAGRILDQAVVPSLKTGNWEEGITKGVDAIMKEAK